jgi:hypothetical protein
MRKATPPTNKVESLPTITIPFPLLDGKICWYTSRVKEKAPVFIAVSMVDMMAATIATNKIPAKKPPLFVEIISERRGMPTLWDRKTGRESIPIKTTTP